MERASAASFVHTNDLRKPLMRAALRKFIEHNSEMYAYGFNLVIKEYARFPAHLPMPCHMEHGWTALTPPLTTDLRTCKELMLVFSKRRKGVWQKESRIPVEIMGAPFIHYRRMHHLAVSPSASGTVAFAAHSGSEGNVDYDLEQHCKVLKELPAEFQPVRVCLIHPDIQKGRDRVYRRHGFEIVSPGWTNGYGFVRNSYDILSRSKYATSNVIGSYTFHAVEMGLPFFLLGEEPVGTLWVDDPNILRNEKVTHYHYGRVATELFSTGPTQTISKEQREFVLEETGVNDCLSREQLNRVLWDAFKQNHYGRRVPVYLFLNALRRLRYGSRFQ